LSEKDRKPLRNQGLFLLQTTSRFGFPDYQLSCPWQELEQVRFALFHPVLAATFFTPLLWVAALKDVLL
jgi:hypothetical protein